MGEERSLTLKRWLDKGIRYDGRKLMDYRQVEVEYGISKSAEGSARVKIGNTEVMAGVKLAVNTPYPDTPDEGCLRVEVLLLPMSNPDFEPGPPSIEAVELSRVVDRGIREAKAIDMKEMCIEPGEKVWDVSIDVAVINDEGNLFDACALAALAALKDTRFPVLEEGMINYKEKTEKKLPLTKEPIAIGVVKIGQHLLVDPLNEEEKMADAKLVVTSIGTDTLCALQKTGSVPLTAQEVEKIVEIGLKKAEMVRKSL